MEDVHSFKEFVAIEREAAHQKVFQSKKYFDYHALRLYNTYASCALICNNKSDKLISFGAGSAYVEHALAFWHNMKITVVDFPETISSLSDYYKKSGFQTIAADLTSKIHDFADRYDVALSSEVIEHIPRPPVEHISLLRHAVKPGGDIIVTTPNFGRIGTIVKLLLMRPVLPPPERSFGPVCFENEGVHRREYLPSEIIDAFNKGGVRHIGTTFTENSPKVWAVRGLTSRAVPRFRATMILHGKTER